MDIASKYAVRYSGTIRFNPQRESSLVRNFSQFYGNLSVLSNVILLTKSSFQSKQEWNASEHFSYYLSQFTSIGELHDTM